jgi:hypothetical protein
MRPCYYKDNKKSDRTAFSPVQFAQKTKIKSNMLNSSTGKGFSKVTVTGEVNKTDLASPLTSLPTDRGMDAIGQGCLVSPAIAPKNINGGRANA